MLPSLPPEERERQCVVNFGQLDSAKGSSVTPLEGGWSSYFWGGRPTTEPNKLECCGNSYRVDRSEHRRQNPFRRWTDRPRWQQWTFPSILDQHLSEEFFPRLTTRRVVSRTKPRHQCWQDGTLSCKQLSFWFKRMIVHRVDGVVDIRSITSYNLILKNPIPHSTHNLQLFSLHPSLSKLPPSPRQ